MRKRAPRKHAYGWCESGGERDHEENTVVISGNAREGVESLLQQVVYVKELLEHAFEEFALKAHHHRVTLRFIAG